jgi:hypothetical protein
VLQMVDSDSGEQQIARMGIAGAGINNIAENP